MQKLLRKQKEGGFTLVELMIVIVIIGILAATAIPAFLRFVRRSKTGETGIQLSIMNSGITAYYSESHHPQGFQNFVPSTACLPPNASLGITPTNERQLWGGNDRAIFNTIDFGPSEAVYYNYEITDSVGGCSNTAPGAMLTMRATGDLDGDGTLSTFEFAGGIQTSEEGFRRGALYRQDELE